MSGRFAPSPTSELHLGNLRTAILSQRFADEAGIGHLVRVEDLDQQRVAAAPGIAEQQVADLGAFGVRSDVPVVRQSDRLQLYRDAAQSLDLYPCFCSRRDIVQASQAPHGGMRPYPGTCARLTHREQQERALVRPPAWRVRSGGVTRTVTDRFAGEVTAVVDDFVVVRNDGTPAYNLAVVVDDGLQGVTQVTRGRDLLESAPRQAWLAAKLGFATPEYVHVGLAVTTTGQRLAKRDGAVTLTQLVDSGRARDRASAVELVWQLVSPTLDDPAADWVIDPTPPE
ncbi:tRNA glutamyl-Q(34) synthetase GluQRS [Aestuariimicrobium kwangyangense]|uniref:tRNA glutamyl-Q(34) synthetase GluQRS n=1 Tax=Aestuariimicrobium kwangyangense TaxID=396389 RepID=UPI000428A1F5|nr:tRNA glutamyl-Q(34) synthetase GluQRS [Aestuariimicrobium kwangyangense]